MDGDPSDPLGESWGGSFERISYSPRKIFHRNTTLRDTVSVYSVIEFHFKGPKIDNNIETPCFTFRIDKQDWDGYYLGDGKYCVKYVPKAPAVLEYQIMSEIKELDGMKGEFVVDKMWPGDITKDAYQLGENWYTDKAELSLFEGPWQGFKTVAKWKTTVLLDWEKRWNWLK
ncbi:DUF5060 domain-containing protein [Bacteroides sp. BFG-637]|nr:DUF5060 domain-containing protein [Bacteroides sp. BFG-637]